MKRQLDPISLFKGLDGTGPVMVAVSGGSDSIALLLLASAWANHANRELQVVTVDHGLRPEAASEAAFVAGVSQALDLPHVTLAWDGIKPLSGISEAARGARYQLMTEYARDCGFEIILTGHTLNDQAETIFMRSTRESTGSQFRGLAGMADEVMLSDGVYLRRPLLTWRREELRAYLRENQQSWIEDPTNEDLSYERVRVRNLLGHDRHFLEQISRFGEINARQRKLVSSQTAMLLDDNLEIGQGPVLELSSAAMDEVPVPVLVLALQVVISAVGGLEYLPQTSRIEEFLAKSDKKRITTGNAVVEKRTGAVRIYREKRNLPSILVPPGEEAIWDGRLRIENDTSMTYFCGPMDAGRISQAEEILDRKLSVSPRAALESTPYLCGDGDDLFLPLVRGFECPKGLRVTHVIPSIETFCPSFDFPLLRVVKSINARIMGEKQCHP